MLGGESFVALAEGLLRRCMWARGRGPLSTAATACRPPFADAATRSSRQNRGPPLRRRFCAHCGIEPTRNNRRMLGRGGRDRWEGSPAVSRQAIEDALLLRGSHDFDSSMPIAASSTRSSAAGNARLKKRLELERPALQMLPERLKTDYEETIVVVAWTSGFTLKKVFCSVPSRLIGHRLRVRLYDDRLDCLLGSTPLMTLRRGRAHPSGKRGHVVDYRHVVHALQHKPMAFSTWFFASGSFHAAPTSAQSRRCSQPTTRSRRAAPSSDAGAGARPRLRGRTRRHHRRRTRPRQTA